MNRTEIMYSDIRNVDCQFTQLMIWRNEISAPECYNMGVKAKIAEETERNINYKKRFHTYEFVIKNEVDAISHATCGMAIDIEAKVIVACTMSGRTARMVSRFRGPVDIIGLTTSEKTWRKLALSWGVTPRMCEMLPSTDVLFYTAKKEAESSLNLKSGDRLVITGGVTNGQSGNTNLIKIETV